MFFYFFESRGNVDKDPVLMWINGGPGCSSSLGLFMELGPCSIGDPFSGSNATIFNPNSWNTNANLFFLDQPVGVGFSYSDYGEPSGTTEDAAKDVAAFVTIFFETFSQFKGREFHMSGESYAGRYLPVFASEVVDQNKRAEASGFTPINLASVLIGNGITDSTTMIYSYYDIQCTSASIKPFQDISTCVRMKKALARCKHMREKVCGDSYDAFGCAAADLFCQTELSGSFFATGLNPYDISKPCEGKIEETLCYPITKKIADYLNQPSTRKMLGVDKSIGNYTGCNRAVGQAFGETQDFDHSSKYYVANLLERGVRILVYVGTYDFICNHVGNYRWTADLDWTGKKAFNTQELQDWHVNTTVAGKTRSAHGLTFATIFGAGHMVPYDKPVESLAMLNRWLAGKDLDDPKS
jgi:carboxypeptidase C (cathepsin A)